MASYRKKLHQSLDRLADVLKTLADQLPSTTGPKPEKQTFYYPIEDKLTDVIEDPVDLIDNEEPIFRNDETESDFIALGEETLKAIHRALGFRQDSDDEEPTPQHLSVFDSEDYAIVSAAATASGLPTREAKKFAEHLMDTIDLYRLIYTEEDLADLPHSYIVMTAQGATCGAATLRATLRPEDLPALILLRRDLP